jgi:hypothetical protein
MRADDRVQFHPTGVSYQVPLRSLQPRVFEPPGRWTLPVRRPRRLASIRVMGPSLALAQAAGTAAALAARDGVPVSEVTVDELQGSLSKQGAIL